MTRPDPARFRDLLRHLPDLLAGPDPILNFDKAATLVRQDDDMRHALVACGELLTMMRQGTRRMAFPKALVGPEIISPIETAERYFGTTLMESLFQVGLYYMSIDLAEKEEFVSCFFGGTPRRRIMEDVRAESREYCKSLGLAPDMALQRLPVKARAIEEARSPARDVAGVAFDACESLRPGLEGVGYWRVYVQVDGLSPRLQERAWSRYSKRCRVPAQRARGVHHLARALSHASRRSAALSMSVAAAEWRPHDPVIVLHGLLHALFAHDRSKAHTFGRHIADCWSADPEFERLILAAVATSAGPWKDERTQIVALLEQISEQLPAKLYRVMRARVE